MGCDIHLRVEKRVNGQWTPAEPMRRNRYWEPGGDEPELEPVRFYDGRNYDLFAILANVRNGRGFAGVSTGLGFIPISEPKGLPIDVSPDVEKDSESWGSDGHSHSWITLRELLDFDWTQKTYKEGWITPLIAEEWLRRKPWEPAPSQYCGGVAGQDVIHISIDDMEKSLKAIKDSLSDRYDHKAYEAAITKAMPWTYAQARWEVDYARACKTFWFETMPKLLRVGKPDDVRLVFWFDN